MKLKKQMFSDIPGAVFVARDTDSYDNNVLIWPAGLGIEKHFGCIEFYGKVKYKKKCEAKSFATLLTIAQCKAIYFDFPKKEEAWLVTPMGSYLYGDNYIWERIDQDLELIK